MRFIPLLTAVCILSAAATAQTTIRGKVEDVQGTANQFYLDGTNIPVVSNVLNLNQWQGQHAFLDVTNIGTAASPVLRIDAATPTAKMIDMDNLRLGQTRTWEVFAPTGSFAVIFVDWTANARFVPVPTFGGAWLMGAQPFTLDAGVTGAGVFQTSFTMPNNPAFLGLEVSSQALVGAQNAWQFSNVDSKVVEN